MHLSLLYYANLLVCGLVFLELVITSRKNPQLKLYLLLIVASLFAMNYFALTGIETRVQFIAVKFTRLVYVSGTLLALIHLVHPKIPRLLIAFIAIASITITSTRIANYDQINMESLPSFSNQIFSVGIEFYAVKTIPRYIGFGSVFIAIIIAYYYYRRLLMKLNWQSTKDKHLSSWIISLVIPFFMLTIFAVLGNLKVFNETMSSYLFAIFSFASIGSFILRPRGLEKKEFGETKFPSPYRGI